MLKEKRVKESKKNVRGTKRGRVRDLLGGRPAGNSEPRKRGAHGKKK